MTSIAIEQAPKDFSRLPELVARGEQVLITGDRAPVAVLAPMAHPQPKPTFGSDRGLISEDFREYLE